MGKTKQYYIENNGFRDEYEVLLEAELMRQKEEYLYYNEFKQKKNGNTEENS